jgi:DNA invertase Pin-like site-specific DNA recombinase
MKKVAFYIRCSTAEQNPKLQIRDLDTICSEEHDVYMENESAWADNVTRPEFNKVIALIKKRKLTDLFVWDLDRIQRNRKRLVEFFVLCKNYGCKIHSYRQTWLEDINSIPEPFNEIVVDLLINVTGWMAQDESLKKSQRVLMAVKRRKDGTFSYKGNRWGRKSLPKQTIDRILELHEDGKSIRQIAALVKVYDKNNHGRNISTTSVHRTILEYRKEKNGK